MEQAGIRPVVTEIANIDEAVQALIEDSLVDNKECMHWWHCLFSPSHAYEVASLAGAQLLAQLPIDPKMAELSDLGEIEAIARPELDAVIVVLKNL